MPIPQPQELNQAIDEEMQRGQQQFGAFNSPHELYAVLLEELDEFWDSVKRDRPNPWELIQLCAIAKRGILQFQQDAEE